jgi:(R,R)-butanediol dehydrogenase / meso-butanediol dehydrogenase / diacetyl reductase
MRGQRRQIAAIECAGNENSLAACLHSVRRQGTVVQVGLATAACNIDLQLLVMKDVTLRGSFCYPIYSWPRVIALIAARKLPVEKTINSRVSLDAAVSDGFEVLNSPGTDGSKSSSSRRLEMSCIIVPFNSVRPK